MIEFGERPVIAVTGSAGKTMVKTMISAILRERWVIFESYDYNNTTEKTLEHKEEITLIHRAVVLEYGMAYAGVLTRHCEIIQPNIGIITNIGLAHIGNFDGDINELIKAKGELITGMNQDGILFLCADDENSSKLDTSKFRGKVFTVGINNEASYKALKITTEKLGQSFTVNLHNEDIRLFIPIIGVHNIYNALFAIGVADSLGFTKEEIITGLNNLKNVEHRLEVHELRDGIVVIDDTVHANPIAMKRALDTLAEYPAEKRIAILGSMPELGEDINQYHEDVGRYVAQKNIDYLYTYGNVSSNIGTGAIVNGFNKDNYKHFTPLYRRVMHKELLKVIVPNTVILVKGASRLGMYNTVEYLLTSYQDGKT